MYIDHNVLFSGDYISALRGCCPLKFLHALQIDPGLLVHTRKRNGVPQKILIVKIKKFGLKFSVLPSITSGLLEVHVSSQNFFQSTCRKAGLINWVQFLEGPPPKICEGKKSSTIFRDFWQFSTLIANICGTDSHINNAPYTWVPWKFWGLPDYAHGYYSQQFSGAFVRIDNLNVPTKFEVRSFIRSSDNRGYPKNLDSPWIRPRSLFYKIFNGLLFRLTL